MTPQRVLIVEPDHPFGLSLAALFQEDGCATRVAGGAAEAELEIATRRPDLIVVRAELPDLSGFSLCARLRHDRSTARLPVILYSSDTAPASLAEHARTPWAANGYLAMPLDTSALRTLARRILAASAVVESADDAVIEEAEPLADAGPPPPPPPPSPAPADAAATPPPVPRRAVRTQLTEEDRLLAVRIFGSIAERRDALLAEARQHRPPPRRDLLQSADGRLQLLRDDLKAREAQIAQLAELWEIREREVEYSGEWLHEKDVELQGLRGEVEDLRNRVAEGRALAAEREREHGASIDGLLLEKVKQENELIEVVAASERRVHELRRELRGYEEELDRRAREARAAEEALALARHAGEEALVEAERSHAAERSAWDEQRAGLEARLAAERERCETLAVALAEARGQLEAAAAEGARRAEEHQGEIADRDRLLAAARRENERLQGELTSARHDLMVSVSEGNAAAEREVARAAELAQLLAVAQRERDDARAASPSGTPEGEGGAEPRAEEPAPSPDGVGHA
jgi:ParB family chromosome partitioning protein